MPFLSMKIFERIRRSNIERSLNQTYRRRLDARGNTPQGVFWNSKKNQTNRFITLLDLIKGANREAAHPPRVTIAEIGCGYGALFALMNSDPTLKDWHYQGVDINPAMIKACIEEYPGDQSRFYRGSKPREFVDYCLFSGTFNLCPIDDMAAWEAYILDSLETCWALSRRGMAINLLCQDTAFISKRIYYANSDRFIASATKRFGPTIAVPTQNVKGDIGFLIAKA